MAQEAIDTIKKAEEDAKNIIINSEHEAQRLISEAENEKKSSLAQLESELKEKYVQAVENAKKTAGENSTASLAQAEKEAQDLTEQLNAKKNGAVGRILDSLTV